VSSLSAPAKTIEVTPVESKKDLDLFIRLPWRVYSDNEYWVPPLLFTERQRFSAKHNPFYKHAEVQLFLARRDGKVCGRISAQIDSEHNKYHEERTGFFGFLECQDDPEVAGALLNAAEDWLRERGMNTIRGPFNFSINEEIGFLAEGFDSSPLPLMPYTHEYYLGLMETAGYVKVKDVYAWRWQSQPVPEGPPRRMADELRSRPEVTIRRARMSDFKNEVARLLEMYNDAWSENWGFVPATDAEAEQMANDLKLVVDTKIIPVVEVEGVPAGMALALPNINWAMKPLNGKLFPFGWLRFLWRLKIRRPKSGRLLLLGIKKQFRGRKYAGLAYLLCEEIYRGANERGYDWAEFSWTLEDNGLINSLIKKIGAERYKTYRLFEKTL
jgi:GNAT superfamily N-acetyltransferase